MVLAIIMTVFSIVFSPACEDVVIVNRTSGILESIHYPRPYATNERCNWTIQVTTGNTVNYTFLDFDMEDHNNCSTDYLEVGVLGLNGLSCVQIKLD